MSTVVKTLTKQLEQAQNRLDYLQIEYRKLEGEILEERGVVYALESCLDAMGTEGTEE